MPPDDDSKSARQLSRSQMRRTGDRSARIAMLLMKMSAPSLKKLDLEDRARESLERARAVKTHIARRRAERTLAGDLRKFVEDLVELEEAIVKIEEGSSDSEAFHLAEQWRTRLLEGAAKVAETFPGGASEEMPRLVEAAKREKEIGKPPGAGRALFRHIVELIKVHQRALALAAAESDDAAADDDNNDNNDNNDNDDDGND